MRRIALTLILAILLLASMAAPALATNDPTVPADECSDNPKAVGQPFGENANAVDIGPSPVSGPASKNNPSGTSPGAQGQEASDTAQGNCQ